MRFTFFIHKKIDRITLLMVFFFSVSCSYSQVNKEDKSTQEVKKIEPQEDKFSAEIDVVYPNLSRGILLNAERVAIQMSASYTFIKNLTFGVWVSTNFSSDQTAYNEYDFTLAYEVTEVFTVEVGDYYTPATKQNNEVYGGYRTPFFDYGIYSSQVVELCLLFDFTPKDFPLDFQWDTVFLGNDYKDVVKDNEGNVVSKKRAFSSYSELGYTKSFQKYNLDVRPFVGAAVINDAGYYGYYRNGKTGFSFINVGLNVTKNFIIFKKYMLPVFIQYAYNEDGNYNKDRTELSYSFISAGVIFSIK